MPRWRSRVAFLATISHDPNRNMDFLDTPRAKRGSEQLLADAQRGTFFLPAEQIASDLCKP